MKAQGRVREMIREFTDLSVNGRVDVTDHTQAAAPKKENPSRIGQGQVGIFDDPIMVCRQKGSPQMPQARLSSAPPVGYSRRNARAWCADVFKFFV